MHLFVRGINNTFMIPLRSAVGSGDLKVAISSPSGVTLFSTTVTINGEVAETLQPSSRGTGEIYLNQDIPVGPYWLNFSGNDFLIEIIRCQDGIAFLRQPLNVDVPVGAKVYNYYVTFNWIPGQETEGINSVLVEWQINDSNPEITEALIVNRILTPPLSGVELLSLYPRLNELTASDQGFNPDSLIYEAWDILRSRFWQDGLILDHIRSPEALKGALLAQVQLILAQQGLAPIGYMEPSDYLREAERRLNLELARVARSDLWIDSNDDKKQDIGENGPFGIRMKW